MNIPVSPDRHKSGNFCIFQQARRDSIGRQVADLLVFTYGTLKSDQPNGYRMQQIGARLIGEVRSLDPFPLVVASEYNVPAMLNVPGRGHRVLGELYAVRDISQVDAFEGHPSQYRRGPLRVELVSPQPAEYPPDLEPGSGPLECCCYFLHRPRAYLLQLPMLARYFDGVLGLPFMPKIIGLGAVNRRREVMTQMQLPDGEGYGDEAGVPVCDSR